MRVWIYGNEADEYCEFPTATHWESCGGDWVELLDDNDNIVCILNWKHIAIMEPIP